MVLARAALALIGAAPAPATAPAAQRLPYLWIYVVATALVLAAMVGLLLLEARLGRRRRGR